MPPNSEQCSSKLHHPHIAPFRACQIPAVTASTETPVLKAGLEHLGGRCAITSVNYEDGDGPESRFHKTMERVVEHGAAVGADHQRGDEHYARDGFEGLRLMDTIMSAKRGEVPDADSPQAQGRPEKEAKRKARHERPKRIAAQRKAAETPIEVPARSDVAADVEVPAPPFWGTRIVKGVALADYTGLLDERALFLGQWGLRGVKGGEGPSYEELVETEGRSATALLARPAVHRRHPGARRRGLGRIGVELSEELQLHPEQSTDAFVLHHPEAKYFNV